MRSAITVSLVPQAAGGPFVFWEGLDDAMAQARAAGFDAIEIFPAAATAIDVAKLEACLARHGLRVAAIGTGAGWILQKLTLTHGDAGVRRQAREFVGAVIDVAARFGAPAIIGSMQGRWEGDVPRAQAVAFLGEALEELGERSASHGVPLLYEPLNRYETNLFNRLHDTAGWLKTLRTRNVRILADLFHMNIEEANSAAALRAAGSLVGHVHFADSNRRAVGFGQTPMLPVMDALRAIGYEGYLSAEILPLPDSAAAARQAMVGFRQYAGAS